MTATGKTGKYDIISERMKNYEHNQGPMLDDSKPFMIRLDGHKFSTFAAPFRKPFDELLHRVMVATAGDLLDHYHCTTAYTQSDEITLVFPALNATAADNSDNKITKSLLHSGRIMKISTLASAYCSTRFNFHCLRLADMWPNEEFRLEGAKKGAYRYDLVQKKLRGGVGYFDARTFNVDSEKDLLDNILWRSQYDCRRNSLNNLGRMYYSTKEMHGVKNRQLEPMLLEEKGVKFSDWPLSYRYGTFIKKQMVEKVGENPLTGKTETVYRGVIKCYGLEPKDEQEYLDMLLCKYWDNSPLIQNAQLVEI